MMIHCDKLFHPLLSGGTQQRDRLLASLIPGELKLDDRSIEDLIAFAGTLSLHVRYWDETNTGTTDWLPFWESDSTSLLAIIASTDLESAKTEFRTKELEYRRLKKKEEQGRSTATTSASVVDDMVTDPSYGVYGLALMVANICSRIPGEHPLKADVINIAATLKDPLYRLIQFHKAVYAQAILRYTPFIGSSACAIPWGLPDQASFECIDFVLPYEHVDELWKLFLKFYKALLLILEKARRAFHSALRTRHNHEPHIALFITFLHLFRYLQQDLNSLTEKHLLFYYHDVLRLEKRRLVPDKVHLVFEIAANLLNYRITKDTEFKAGNDLAGMPMTYRLNDELVVSQAKLVEKQNLYFKGLVPEAGDFISAIRLPAADKRDGVEEEWPEAAKEWVAHSGMHVFNRLYYKYRQLEKLEHAIDKNLLPALRQEKTRLQTAYMKLHPVFGFSISSPELWLNGGMFRIISVDIEFIDAEPNNLLNIFDADISTEKGIVSLKKHPIEVEDDGNPSEITGLPESLTGIVRVFQNLEPGKDDPTAYSLILRLEERQRYIILLHPEFPSILPLDKGTSPFIRFHTNFPYGESLKKFSDATIYSYAEGNLASILPQVPPAVLFRQTGGQVEESTEMVITETNNTISLRMPELFAKAPEYLNIQVEQDFFNNQSVRVLFNEQWHNVTNNIPQGLSNMPDTGNYLSAPTTFDFTSLEKNETGWIELQFRLVGNDPRLLIAEEIQLQYRSMPVNIEAALSANKRRNFISYFSSLGDWLADPGSNNGITPLPILLQPRRRPVFTLDAGVNPPADPPLANGNLFLGFEKIIPGQTLSILFRMSEGTGNPDHYAPTIAWSYLSDNEWIEFPPQFILKDTTLGMQQTGIILFQLPGDINNGNTWIKGKDGRTDLYWIRSSVSEIPADDVFVDALPWLVDIHVHAGEAEFDDLHNREDHLVKGLPAGRITALRYRDVNVKTIRQPFTSFDGRVSENNDKLAYIRRIHERLRHKARAVTVWDYERLVLEAFIDVSVTKCLPHTRRIYTARPGNVTMAVIPFPEKMKGNRIYYPSFNAGRLSIIHKYLAERNSYFVGGFGDPGFCCCEDDCKCGHHNRLKVINARFEPVRLKLCVRFYEGRDIPYYKKELNELLKRFLSPWAKDSKPLLFGLKISVTSLLQFLENLEFVDVVLNLQVKHFATKQMAEENETSISWDNPKEILPYTAASVLTTYIDKLNEDNPNVIDHVINVVETHGRCSCEGCNEDAVMVPVDPHLVEIERLRIRLDDIWRVHTRINNVITDLKVMVDEMVMNGELAGSIPATPTSGQEFRDAYNVEKIKSGPRIIQLKVSLAFSGDAGRFTDFRVNNPHLNDNN